MMVAASIPTITTVPRMRRASAPAPEAIQRGADPKMKANEVIRMGRRRRRAPSSAASIKSRPFANSALANSTIRIAFFRREANQHDQSDLRIDAKVVTAQPDAKKCTEDRYGAVSSTENGRDQLSYSAARIRKTKTSDSPNTVVVVPEPSAPDTRGRPSRN